MHRVADKISASPNGAKYKAYFAPLGLRFFLTTFPVHRTGLLHFAPLGRGDSRFYFAADALRGIFSSRIAALYKNAAITVEACFISSA